MVEKREWLYKMLVLSKRWINMYLNIPEHSNFWVICACIVFAAFHNAVSYFVDSKNINFQILINKSWQTHEYVIVTKLF